MIQRIDRRALDNLEALIGRMAATGDLREQATWDYEFHLAIVQMAGNAVVSRTYRVMAEPMKRLMELGKGTHGTQAAIEQHAEMVGALKARDVAAYSASLTRHMTYGRQYLAAQASDDLDRVAAKGQ